MKRLVWLTDIHLNFLTEFQIKEFCQTVVSTNPDAVLISGDISEAPNLEAHLRTLEQFLKRPIFFVLGNHDFYHGSIEIVRNKVRKMSESSSRLKWLPNCGVVELSKLTGLIGHDSWGDGRLGKKQKSEVLLNDFLLIQDLSKSPDLFCTLNALGDESSVYLKRYLPDALKRYRHVIVLVHVPPFKESCWHEGHISDNDWLPHFTCHAVGEILLQIMCEHPDNRMTVLCGHTHSSGFARILPNLEVKTGVAVYGRPQIQEVLSIE